MAKGCTTSFGNLAANVSSVSFCVNTTNSGGLEGEVHNPVAEEVILLASPSEQVVSLLLIPHVTLCPVQQLSKKAPIEV